MTDRVLTLFVQQCVNQRALSRATVQGLRGEGVVLFNNRSSSNEGRRCLGLRFISETAEGVEGGSEVVLASEG